jgi:DNA-binding NarL/FixJ family response regulator
MGKANSTRKTTVCLLSSHPMVLAELERLLAPVSFKVQVRRLGSALAPGLERLSLPRARAYVIDAHAPHQATEVLIAGIRERYPQARQLVVAEKFNEVSAFPLLRLGAKGLLCYTDTHEKLTEALQAVAAGGFWVPRDLLSRFIDSNLGVMHRQKMKLSPGNITVREREVLDALLKNQANKEIADKLNISERTVKFHVSSLLEKFSVRRRADLILLCLQEHTPRT